MSCVVSSNGTDVRTAAAQTRAAGRPARPAAVNRRSTSCSWLTSVGTAVACAARGPDASRDGGEGLAVAGREQACAPAAATAAAVAAPMPRLAPVTIATRPASQCAGQPRAAAGVPGR